MLVLKGCLVMEKKVGLGGENNRIYTPSFHHILYSCSLFDLMFYSFERASERLAVTCLFIVSCFVLLTCDRQTDNSRPWT
jgi:hypothetical protein